MRSIAWFGKWGFVGVPLNLFSLPGNEVWDIFCLENHDRNTKIISPPDCDLAYIRCAGLDLHETCGSNFDHLGWTNVRIPQLTCIRWWGVSITFTIPHTFGSNFRCWCSYPHYATLIPTQNGYSQPITRFCRTEHSAAFVAPGSSTTVNGVYERRRLDSKNRVMWTVHHPIAAYKETCIATFPDSLPSQTKNILENQFKT